MGRRRSLLKDRALHRVGFLKEEQEKGAVVLFSVLRIGGNDYKTLVSDLYILCLTSSGSTEAFCKSRSDSLKSNSSSIIRASMK